MHKILNLIDFSILNLKLMVDHPNGTVANVTHVGSLKLSDTLVLHDVSMYQNIMILFKIPWRGLVVKEVLGVLKNVIDNGNISDSSPCEILQLMHDTAVTPNSIDITSDVSTKSHTPAVIVNTDDTLGDIGDSGLCNNTSDGATLFLRMRI
ncbi:hypothetical protein Tco_1504225 [Tanacetum coccineum]